MRRKSRSRQASNQGKRAVIVAHKALEYAATGRRKTSVARVRIAAGEGKLLVNGREMKSYFTTEPLRTYIEQPLKVANANHYNVTAIVSGGGQSGQAGALRHGIARALVLADNSLRPVLKDSGFLTRDPRMRERKKSGQPGARKRYQFSKR
jgi:small subunit ribosomal protein S9